MGLIRGGLVVIVSVLLLLSFILVNIFLTLNLSLEYDVIKLELTPIIKELALNEMNLDDEINNDLDIMNLYCENNSEYVFSYEEEVFVIPCEIISQGSEVIIDYGIDSLVSNVYYQNYDCKFWDCFKENPSSLFFLVSEKSKNYWKNKFYLCLVFSVFLVVVLFFLVEQKPNSLIIPGSMMIIASLPFMKLNWLLSFFTDNAFLQFFTFMFSQAYTVFLIFFILGIIILIAGGVFKLFSIGFKVSNFFQKKNVISKDEVKQVVKQEISDSKKKK
ncbi:MAG: hypothetical protein KJ646_00200 [Nanoarchaeota archaeon]|nr:hypothetical protein [Nanoarchaeota archaeon]